MLRYLDGKDCNGIYDGATFMPFLLGHSYASNFQHLHDFEPMQMNHYVPHYGKHWSATYDELEHNEYLLSKGIKPEEVRHPAAQARHESGEHHSLLAHAEHH